MRHFDVKPLLPAINSGPKLTPRSTPSASLVWHAQGCAVSSASASLTPLESAPWFAIRTQMLHHALRPSSLQCWPSLPRFPHDTQLSRVAISHLISTGIGMPGGVACLNVATSMHVGYVEVPTLRSPVVIVPWVSVRAPTCTHQAKPHLESHGATRASCTTVDLGRDPPLT